MAQKSKKKATEMTTEELAQRLFPPKVLEKVKQRTNPGEKQPKKKAQ